MLKQIKIALATLAMCAFCGCAETPDGTIVVNEETIENFLENGKGGLKSWNPPSDLNLVLDQPVAAAKIPDLAPGQFRISGTLDSAGMYRIPGDAQFPGANQRGSTFHKSVFGMLGSAGQGGNAWFFADADQATGQITQARAYLYGFLDGVCDMRQPASGSWGNIGQSGFTLTIDGLCHFPDQSGSTAEYALVIQGPGNLMTTSAKIPVRYIMDNNGRFDSVPDNPQSFSQIYDYGNGEAVITR